MLLLVLVPIICIMNRSYAQMPSWWAMTNLNYLHNSRVGAVICIWFLSSIVFDFLSGLYLLNAKPFQKKGVRTFDQKNKSDIGFYYNDGCDPMLGWLTICSGGICLLYHSFQTTGPLNVAESICFVDHGFAVSSACYFFDKCGVPSLMDYWDTFSLFACCKRICLSNCSLSMTYRFCYCHNFMGF